MSIVSCSTISVCSKIAQQPQPLEEEYSPANSRRPAAVPEFPSNFNSNTETFSFDTAYHAGKRYHVFQETQDNGLPITAWTNFLKDNVSVNWGLWAMPQSKFLNPLMLLDQHGDFLIAIEFYDDKIPKYSKDKKFETLKKTYSKHGADWALKSGTLGENILIQHPKLIRKIRFLNEDDLRYFFKENAEIARSIEASLDTKIKNKALIRLMSSFPTSPLIHWENTKDLPELFYQSLMDIQKQLVENPEMAQALDQIKKSTKKRHLLECLSKLHK